MKEITVTDINYGVIFKYPELKYIFNIYKKYKNKFKYQYNQLKTYTYCGKPSVKYIFVGAFLRINEFDLMDLTEMYVFIEVPYNNLNNKLYLFIDSLLNFHNKFIETNIDSLSLINDFNIINNYPTFNKIISEFKMYDTEIITSY